MVIAFRWQRCVLRIGQFSVDIIFNHRHLIVIGELGQLLFFVVALYGPKIIEHAMNVWDVSTTVAVVFQAYPTTLFGYWVWNRLLIRYPLSTTAPLTLLVPVFALISGYFMYDEVLGSAQILACVLFFVGIGLIVKPTGKGQALSRYSHQVSKT